MQDCFALAFSPPSTLVRQAVGKHAAGAPLCGTRATFSGAVFASHHVVPPRAIELGSCSDVLSNPPRSKEPGLCQPFYRFQQSRRFTATARCSITTSTQLFLGGGSNRNSNIDDRFFDPKTTAVLIGGQSALILVAVALAYALRTPNYGFGPAFSWDGGSAIVVGSLLALPLGLAAAALNAVEERFPALKDVSKATQRSVLSLMGGKFKPLLGMLVSTGLGVAAGVGEVSRLVHPYARFASFAIVGNERLISTLSLSIILSNLIFAINVRSSSSGVSSSMNSQRRWGVPLCWLSRCQVSFLAPYTP